MYSLIIGAVIGAVIALVNFALGNIIPFEQFSAIYAVLGVGFAFTLICGAFGMFVGAIFAMMIDGCARTVEVLSKEQRLVPLAETEKNAQGPVFIKVDEVRGSHVAKATFLNEDGTREMQIFHIGSAVRILEDPACADVGVWRTFQKSNDTTDWRRHFVMNDSYRNREELRVPVGTVER